MDLATAKVHLDAWLKADLALATSKSYQLGDRQLTRVNASEVKERISHWQRVVNQLSGRGRKIRYGVPQG
jgi:hypothetical protein